MMSDSPMARVFNPCLRPRGFECLPEMQDTGYKPVPRARELFSIDNWRLKPLNCSPMPLPILTHRPPPEPADLIRFYHRAQLHWAQQLGDDVQLDVGSTFANP